ncbi:Putative transcriptional regulatory protein [[Actinomadura] parvosata subsp. kistnae]|nr:AsnC family transcriptional regulator [Nonomuraea sp. ATCC 55076]SPL94666.1 Putative transcriptional regulatory protein [Actinomadura parvosata subsp. kistnae]
MADKLDRRLIHALQLDARAPFSRIAEVLGVSDQTVARRYRRLRTADLLRVVAVPPANFHGHGRWMLRLRCVPGAADAIASALARRPDTAWVQLVSGGTEVQCVIRARAPGESEQLLLERLPRNGRVVDVTACSLLHTFYGSPGRVRLLNALTPEEAGRLGPEPDAVTGAGLSHCDADDLRLLSVLARDARTGLADLAAATGWSQSTVRRRMADLRADGALHFYAEFDPAYLGYRASTWLWASAPPAELAAAAEALASHPEIVFAAATTGPTNLVATAICTDAHDVYRYLTERVAALPSITHVETAPIMQTRKRVGRLLGA